MIMTKEQVQDLVDNYFNKEGYVFPGDFEHRVDPTSLGIIYSLLRIYKPKTALQIGCWFGGTTCVVMAGLLKNKLPFQFVASELLEDKLEATKLNVLKHSGHEPSMIGDITANLKSVPLEIDFLYHDTDHDLETTKWVFDNIFPRLKDKALVIFHDWAVEDKNGEWVGKDGMWPETQYMIDLHKKGELPLEKVFWTFEGQGTPETGVFKYIKK